MRRDTTVRNGNLKIAVRDYGGVGRPIVLVHGGPGQNLATWDEFAPALTPDLRTVALDMRGNGASDDADDYSWPALASDIHAVIRELELAQPLLLGHSWGGQLVTYYASQYQDCAGVIAVEGWITDVHSELGDDVWKWIEDSYADDPFITFSGTESQLEPILAYIRENFGLSGAAVAKRQLVEGGDGIYRWRRTVQQLVHIQRTIGDEEGVLNSSLYANVACPVLLIGGERSEEQVQAEREGRLGEWAFGRRATDSIATQYEQVKAEWWPCGHDVPREMLQELATRTKLFSRQI